MIMFKRRRDQLTLKLNETALELIEDACLNSIPGLDRPELVIAGTGINDDTRVFRIDDKRMD